MFRLVVSRVCSALASRAAEGLVRGPRVGALAAVLLAATATPAWSADCAGPLTIAGLDEALTDTEGRFGSLDFQGFASELSVLSLRLPCLDEVVPPPLAARVHTLVGLKLYGDGQIELARASFAAARAATPSVGLSIALVPASHELHALYEDAAISGARVTFSPPEAGELWFDGTRAGDRPTDRPAIVQIVDGAGALRDTRYLLPGDPLPPYAVRPADPLPADPLPAVERSAEPAPRAGGFSPRWSWFAVSAVSAAGSAVLYGVAADQAARFRGPLPEVEDVRGLRAIRQRTNGLVLGAVGAAAVAAGGGVGFVATGVRR